MENSFCPSCHLRNKSDAKYCTYCGASLDPFIRTALTTREVSEKSELEKPAITAEQIAKVPPGALGLFVLDEEEPIIIPQGSAERILGRLFDDAEDTLIDLSLYGAQQLGVSRRHARITYSGEGFALQDLGSTNGTWINNQRILPNESRQIKNDDIINLAWLFMVACLKDGGEEPDPPDTKELTP